MATTFMETNRRSFIRQTAAAGAVAPAFIRNLISAPPSGMLRLASFGSGGMAFVTMRVLASHPKVKVSYVAEVDSAKLSEIKGKYDDAKVYEDWRKMLEKEHKNIDIVCVGTPD